MDILVLVEISFWLIVAIFIIAVLKRFFNVFVKNACIENSISKFSKKLYDQQMHFIKTIFYIISAFLTFIGLISNVNQAVVVVVVVISMFEALDNWISLLYDESVKRGA